MRSFSINQLRVIFDPLLACHFEERGALLVVSMQSACCLRWIKPVVGVGRNIHW